MTKPTDAKKWGENLTRIENLKTKVAEANGNAELWEYRAHRFEHGRNIAQARVKFLEAQFADVRAELAGESTPETVGRALAVLGRSQPVIRVTHRGRK